MSTPQKLMTLVEAIARMEGWLDPISRCRRNNNPGNIEAGKFAAAHGATGSDGRFAIFPSAAAGFAALVALLQMRSYSKLTVAQTIARYAPSNENDTRRYIALVCQWTGAQADDPIAPLLTGPDALTAV
jgi:hypothetical protein